MRCFVEAVGIAAPGLPDWVSARPVLRGETPYVASPLPVYQMQLLAPNERRRVMPAVRQAFRVAEEAVVMSGRPASALATVFTSSEADVEILHRIGSILAEENRVVSPTDFHNSVHNAAAGYWTMAVGSRHASSTLCAYDCSFSAALLEAAAMLPDEAAVLLVAYDVPPPKALFDKRPIPAAASVALVLARERSPQSFAALQLEIADGESAVPKIADAGLQALCLENPALRALPLLTVLARLDEQTLALETAGGSNLQIRVSPLQ